MPEGIDVVVMDALIDLNFLSFMEYSSGVEGLTFARVDADSQTFQKEMTEDEKKQSEEDEKKLADVLHKATGKEDLTVKLASLKDESLPAMLTQGGAGPPLQRNEPHLWPGLQAARNPYAGAQRRQSRGQEPHQRRGRRGNPRPDRSPALRSGPP